MLFASAGKLMMQLVLRRKLSLSKSCAMGYDEARMRLSSSMAFDD